jgi:hypothetical protein
MYLRPKRRVKIHLLGLIMVQVGFESGDGLCVSQAGLWVVGNTTGYPGVFQGNPHPYPWKPVPTAMGAGFAGYGCGFCKTHGLRNPYETRAV